MSFQPVIPLPGLAGWAFLQRTRANLQQTYNASPDIKRDVDYFRANIGSVTTAKELVSDRRLLSVALGAFGLDDDINNKYFVQKILEDGTLKSDALANRLSDKRYLAMSKAFGFGDFSTPKTQLSDFADGIIAAYQDRGFEAAVGEQDPNMRLALGVERDLGSILAKDSTDAGHWFSVMGTPPLRKVFETALGLPVSVGRLDLDRQLGIFRAAADKVFGVKTLSEMSDPSKQEELIKNFLARSQIEAGVSPLVRGSAALALLQGVG